MLGAAAAAVVGILGLRMVGDWSGEAPENKVERVLDRDAIKRGLVRAGLNGDPLLVAQADKDELEMWRLTFLPYPNGDVSQLYLSTTLDHRRVDLAPVQQTVELVARRGERAFDFKVLAARPYDVTRGVWVTKVGRQGYALKTGQNLVVNIF